MNFCHISTWKVYGSESKSIELLDEKYAKMVIVLSLFENNLTLLYCLVTVVTIRRVRNFVATVTRKDCSLLILHTRAMS